MTFLLVVIPLILLSCNSTSKKSEEVKLFNGENLENWKGDSKVWSVEDVALLVKLMMRIR